MKRSIQLNLFYSYSKFFVILILCFAIFFYFFFSDTLKENVSNALIAECDNISTQLDTKLSSMNNLSKHLILSKQVKSLFQNDLYSQNVESAQKRLLFTDLIFSSMDYSSDHITLNFFDKQGRYVNIGSASTFKKIENSSVNQILWAPSVFDAKGAKVFLPPHPDDWGIHTEPVISLCRSFSQTITSPHTSILEIQLEFDVIQNIIDRTLSAQPEPHNLYILDALGNLIYPFEGNDLMGMQSTTQKYYEQITLAKAEHGISNGKDFNNASTFFAYTVSPLTQWTILVEVPEHIFLKPVHQFRNMVILLLVLILLLTLYISYYIAKNLVTPIKNL